MALTPFGWKVRVRDRGAIGRAECLPRGAVPFEPAVLVLVEDVQRLVAKLRKLGAPAGAAPHRVVREDRADDVDFLTGVHLIPQRLEDLPNGCTLGVPPVHELRDVLQADVAGSELFMIEHAHAAPPDMDLRT
jgi:hypothetical protein